MLFINFSDMYELALWSQDDGKVSAIKVIHVRRNRFVGIFSTYAL